MGQKQYCSLKDHICIKVQGKHRIIALPLLGMNNKAIRYYHCLVAFVADPKYTRQELPLRADKVRPGTTALNYFLLEGGERTQSLIWLFQTSGTDQQAEVSLHWFSYKYAARYSHGCHFFVKNKVKKQHIFPSPTGCAHRDCWRCTSDVQEEMYSVGQRVAEGNGSRRECT